MECTGIDIATIRLMKETYGYSDAEIAATTGQHISVVRLAVEEYKMVFDKDKVKEDLTALVREGEIAKQLALMPHYARAEAVILDKIVQGASSCDCTNPIMVATYARALKDLRQISSTMQLGEANNSGITVQILNHIE